MSRHEFKGARGETIVVGWDNPLQTFFVQAGKEDEDTGAYEFTLGMRPAEIPDPNALGDVLDYFGFGIPEGIASRLVTEWAERTAPTENQARWINIISEAIEELQE